LPATAHLTVLTVAPEPVGRGARPDPAFLGVTALTRQQELDYAQQRAEAGLQALNPGETPATAISRWGHPIPTILRTARSEKCDLIVLGAKGHSNLKLLLLGSVAQGVVQHADRPVLIARPGNKGVDSLLLAYDGSPESRRALGFLERLPRPKGLRVVVAQVATSFRLPAETPAGYRSDAQRVSDEVNRRRTASAERRLETALARLHAAGIGAEAELLAGERVESELVEAAARHGSDLIVVGSRKPSAARHYLLGSTAEKLTRHSPTSVLVVR
jgi:nucleotide-binding universal stress UspA family protein